LGFQDESGISEKPFVHTTWALKGKTPVIRSSGSWKKLTLSGIIITDPQGANPRLFLRSIAGNMDSEEAVHFLKDLKRHMGGKKLLLIWDGLPAHRAKIVQEYIETQKHWLTIARFPSYAPEVNPVEYLWGAMKKKYLANLSPDLASVGKALKRCRRKMSDRTLLRAFLRASGLY
jgi:transposase